MAKTKLQVAICGGGITGLVFANLLLKCPEIDFQLYEASQKFEEIGAGIGMWARALDALDEADLKEACKKVATAPPKDQPDLNFEMRKSDTVTPGYMFGKWFIKRGPLFFHRASLLDVLVKPIPSERTHFGKRAISYTEDLLSHRTIIHFTDGSSVECDLLVGCDGIKSAVRTQMYEDAADELGKPELLEHLHPKWSGSVAYRSLISAEELRSMAPNHSIFRVAQMYGGKNKHLIVIPIQQGTIINMVSFVSDFSKENTPYPEERWVKEVSQEELQAAFHDFEPEAQSLLQLMRKPTKWGIHSLGKPLPFYSKGRVVLVGDAAHAMTPHLGIGAGMGLEDARVLAAFLGSPHVNASNVALALQAYDKARVKRTGQVLLRARSQGMAYEMSEPSAGDDLNKVVRFIDDNTEWILNWHVERDIQDGLDWIKQKLGLVPKL